MAFYVGHSNIFVLHSSIEDVPDPKTEEDLFSSFRVFFVENSLKRFFISTGLPTFFERELICHSKSAKKRSPSVLE